MYHNTIIYAILSDFFPLEISEFCFFFVIRVFRSESTPKINKQKYDENICELILLIPYTNTCCCWRTMKNMICDCFRVLPVLR